MEPINAKLLWNEADNLLQLAQIEVNRAEEDIVTHVVCMNSRQSILNYLKGYLYDKGVDPHEPHTMASLHDQCLGLNEKFTDLDLSPINCRVEVGHEDYCMEVTKVNECLEVAQKVKLLVTS